MSFPRFAIVVALILGSAGSVAAQSVTLQFQDGLVTLNAQNAPVRTILAEWARVGGSQIVNGERVVGAPVTLELTNISEREALNVVLRNVSGYLVGARQATSTGASTFGRILILPTSTVVRQAQGAATTFQPPPSPVVAFAPGDPDDDDLSDDVVVGAAPRGVIRTQNPQQLQQELRDAAARAAAARAVEEDFDDAEPPQAPPPATTPGLPGTGRGSGRPGEITPVPPQPRGSRSGGDPDR